MYYLYPKFQAFLFASLVFCLFVVVLFIFFFFFFFNHLHLFCLIFVQIFLWLIYQFSAFHLFWWNGPEAVMECVWYWCVFVVLVLQCWLRTFCLFPHYHIASHVHHLVMPDINHNDWSLTCTCSGCLCDLVGLLHTQLSLFCGQL